jgi:hypothetical protein
MVCWRPQSLARWRVPRRSCRCQCPCARSPGSASDCRPHGSGAWCRPM